MANYEIVVFELLLGLLYGFSFKLDISPCRYRGDYKPSSFYGVGKLMFTENSNIYFSIGLCEAKQSYEILEWKTPYPTFTITSAFKIPSLSLSSQTSENCINNQTDIYFICGINQIRRYNPLQPNILYFEELGIICSFWKRQKLNKWILLDFLPFNKQTIHPGLIAASHLASFTNYLYSTDVKTGYSLVVANAQHQSGSQLIGPRIYGFGPKPQCQTAFDMNEYLNQYQQQTDHPNSPNTKQTRINESNNFTGGWRSNSNSKLWFGENVQFLSVNHINAKHFYIIFTEQDISPPYTAYEGSLSKLSNTITRIGRVCQHDQGLSISASVLPNAGGVFTTFRKTRLACRAYSPLNNYKKYEHRYENKKYARDTKEEQFNEYETMGEKNYLEFNRAIAVSEIVPTINKTDHVFYALMTTVDSLSRIYALCAFNLNAVDQSLNIDHLIRLKQSTNTPSGLSRMVWRDENGTYSNMLTSKWTVDVVPPSKMTDEIMKSSKTCPSQPLSDYYSQFATLHPLVGTTVWALNSIDVSENQTTDQLDHSYFKQKPGQALQIFTLNNIDENVSNESPIHFTVQWDNYLHKDDGNSDIIYVATNKRKIFTIKTGISLQKQIVHSESITSETYMDKFTIKNYFIKKRTNQNFQTMDQFQIVDSDYSIISIHKCNTSDRLSVNMQPVGHTKTSRQTNSLDFNQKTFPQNKIIISFHPKSVICEAYYSCRNCQVSNNPICDFNTTSRTCLLHNPSYAYLNMMNSSLYHFCKNEFFTSQSKQDSFRDVTYESHSSGNISSKRQIKKFKFYNNELGLIQVDHQSTLPMINTKVSSNQSNDSEKDDNNSHFDSNNDNNNNNNKLLHNYVFVIILVLSVFIIFIPLSLICGYLMGKKDYMKQYNLYNKVKDMLDLLYSHPPPPPPHPHHNQHNLYPYPIYYHEASQYNCDEHHQSHHCQHHRHSNSSNNQECYQNHGNCLTTSDVNMIYLCEQGSTNKNDNANDLVNDQMRQSYATQCCFFYGCHPPSEMLNKKTAVYDYAVTGRQQAALKAATLKHIPTFDPIGNIHVISDCMHTKDIKLNEITKVNRNKEYVQRNNTFPTPTKISSPPVSSSSGTTSYTFSSCYTNTATSSYHDVTPFDYFISSSSPTTTLPSTSFKHIQPTVILTETNNNNNNTLLSNYCHQNCYNTNDMAKRTTVNSKPLKTTTTTTTLFGHGGLKKPRTN
ncbi:unnamed protein product [Trichobilharzia szidati]|nr:unnamed protein product [Trichobilharzia szidati]